MLQDLTLVCCGYLSDPILRAYFRFCILLELNQHKCLVILNMIDGVHSCVLKFVVNFSVVRHIMSIDFQCCFRDVELQV